MFRDEKMMAWGYAAAVLLVSVALSLASTGCKDEPTQPLNDEEQQILKPGLNVYVTLDRDDARPGGRVHVTAKVRAVDVILTPVGFQVDLRYDPERLEPIAVAEIEDRVLRAVNLAAGPGLIRAAGAAASSIEDGILFALDMKVKAPAYRGTLALDVKELTVVQQNFADVSADILLAPRAVVVER